jgi:hypothetical protein
LRIILFALVIFGGAALIDFLFMLRGYDPVLWEPKDFDREIVQ